LGHGDGLRRSADAGLISTWGGFRAALFYSTHPERETTMAYRKDWVQPAQGGQGFARTYKAFGRKINLVTADLNLTNNVVGMFMVPKDFVITGMIGPAVPALGTALVLSIGDAALTNRYLASSTIGAAGGALPAMAATGLFFRTVADTEIQLLIATQSSAPAPGILELYFTGFMV
jgi:hypothetical protein